MTSLRNFEPLLSAGFLWVFGCSTADGGSKSLLTAVDQASDPEACAGCHPKHYQQWASSMHAYASDDPLFLAMNRRGQREGQIGNFCVKCHAPMAVLTQATSDGLNLEKLPQKLKGVTCYFCHNVTAVQGTHDNPLQLAQDNVMRGELTDPLNNSFHSSSYSTFLDRDQLDSATLCGSCHDIVNTRGAHLERTFQEWQGSVFSQPQIGTTCGQCHMDQSTALEPVAALAGSPSRHFHSHRFPAIDLPLTPRSDADALATETQAFLDTSLQSALCVRGTGSAAQIRVVLDNVAAGHDFPSGATQDRRVWLEVIAYSNGAVIYQSGSVPAETALATADPTDLVWLGDCLLDANGQQVRMFWQAVDLESSLLPGQLTFDAADPRYYQTHVAADYPRSGASLGVSPDRVTLNVRLAPFDLDVFDTLVKSGDLGESEGVPVAAMRQALATRHLGQELVWTRDTANEVFIDNGVPTSCISATNLRASADTVPVLRHARCGP
jgi:hypothetical protein